jgi:hypothetical protein
MAFVWRKDSGTAGAKIDPVPAGQPKVRIEIVKGAKRDHVAQEFAEALRGFLVEESGNPNAT